MRVWLSVARGLAAEMGRRRSAMGKEARPSTGLATPAKKRAPSKARK